MQKQIYSLLLFITLALVFAHIQHVSALTQFHFAIPFKFENTTDMIFSVDINNKNYSWVDDGISLVPFNNNTSDVFADDSELDLDANEYLFAIDDEIEIGTRVDMCLFSSNYLSQPICQIDAIDTNNLARANFEYIQ
jgi:hypothetical protein